MLEFGDDPPWRVRHKVTLRSGTSPSDDVAAPTIAPL